MAIRLKAREAGHPLGVDSIRLPAHSPFPIRSRLWGGEPGVHPVPEYRLVLDPEDCRWFRRHRGTRRCFPTELHIGDGRWPAWIGYRGRFSRLFAKPSYDLWFGPERPFGGHTALHLNAAYQDPSLLRSCLALRLFSDLQVPTPGAWHARLVVNGRPHGLYTVIESLNAAWLGRQGADQQAIYYSVGGDGNLSLIGRRSRRPKPHPAQGFEKCYPESNDFSDLEAFLHQVAEPDDDAFASAVAATVDVEACLRWLSGLVFLSHTDGFVQNFALVRLADGLWRLSPWDCDGTFGRCPDGAPLPADEVPIDGHGDNYLMARLLRSPWRRRYWELWEELLAGPLSVSSVSACLEAIFTAIQFYGLQDIRKRYSNRAFIEEPDYIRSYLRRRTRYIRRALASGPSRPTC